MDAYKMELSFGKADDLGIPFAISLIVNGDTNTNIKGHYFATFKDIIVQNGQIDTTYDSFDTLGYLTQQHLQTKYQDIEWQKRFGASYVGSGKSNYPKAGFIGYEVSIKDVPDTVVKAQLYKDENGWRVINLLTGNQIHQAHPVAEYIIKNKRSLQSHLAQVAAALALEKQLNDEGVMPKVRATNTSCYTSKDLNKASCKMIYGIREGEDIVCMNKNYLVIQTDNKWQVEKQILETEKIDYKSGELVTYKPSSFGISCN